MATEPAPGESLELPTDIESTEALIRTVQGEIADIQAQMGNRDRRHPDGTRYEPHEYWQWRGRAAYAMTRKLEDLREIKAHVRRLRDEEYAGTAVHPDSAKKLLDNLVTCYRSGDTAGTLAALAKIAKTWKVRD